MKCEYEEFEKLMHAYDEKICRLKENFNIEAYSLRTLEAS